MKEPESNNLDRPFSEIIEGDAWVLVQASFTDPKDLRVGSNLAGMDIVRLLRKMADSYEYGMLKGKHPIL